MFFLFSVTTPTMQTMQALGIRIIDQGFDDDTYTSWIALKNHKDANTTDVSIKVTCTPTYFRIHRTEEDSTDVYDDIRISVPWNNFIPWFQRVRSIPDGYRVICFSEAKRDPHTHEVAITRKYDHHMYIALSHFIKTCREAIRAKAATCIQAGVRGWRSRRRFARHRMLLFNDLLAMPPMGKYPGGTAFHQAMQRYSDMRGSA